MKNKRNSFAQSIIEFALILPMALLLLLGFLDIVRAVFYYSSLTNAVRESARTGIALNLEGYDKDSSIKATIDTSLKNKVLQYAFGLTNTPNPLVASNISVSITKDTDNLYFEKVSITATYCYVPITPGIMLIVKSTCNGSKGIQLRAKSIIRIY
jgi:Flp pilus assembly protein TadG